MTSLIVETYFHHRLAASFNVALTSIHRSPSALPQDALKALRDCDLELQQLLNAIERDHITGHLLEAVDYDSGKRVCISVAKKSGRQLAG